MKNGEKSPAFQWYPKDYLSSGRVAVMTLEEEGAYRRALDFCWLDGHIPSDPKQLALLIGKGCTETIAAKVQTMFTKLRRSDDKLCHKRLTKERVKQAQFIEKCREAGSKSWDARKCKNRVGSTNPHQTLEPKSNSSISYLQSPSSVPPTPQTQAGEGTETQKLKRRIGRLFDINPETIWGNDTEMALFEIAKTDYHDGLEAVERAWKRRDELFFSKSPGAFCKNFMDNVAKAKGAKEKKPW